MVSLSLRWSLWVSVVFGGLRGLRWSPVVSVVSVVLQGSPVVSGSLRCLRWSMGVCRSLWSQLVSGGLQESVWMCLVSGSAWFQSISVFFGSLHWSLWSPAGVTCQNRKCNNISRAVFLCLCFEYSRCRNKVEKNYLEK